MDPVGACVGLRGVRIQNVIRELMNEKIDVLKWDADPAVFIKNALSPAQVERVIITDADKKQALAIVEDSQFSLAIGRQGQNVRLANRLCDWNIDVKTIEQAEELDLSSFNTVQNARNLFNDEAVEEISKISELPGVDAEVAELLKNAGIEEFQDFVEAYDNGTINVEGVSKEALDKINDLISENVEFVEEDESEAPAAAAEDEASAEQKTETESAAEEEEEEYFCPECGAKITLDMTHCPKCGVEFEFTDEE